MSDAPAIDESLRELTYQDKDGYPYIIHPLMDGVPRVQPELLREWTAWASGHALMEGATVILAPEAMALPLAATLSVATDVPYVVARKRSYELADETIAYCETGYGTSCIYINDIGPNDRVVIVDDVVSTGGTLTSIIATLKSLGARVQGVLCPISKGDGAEKVRQGTDVPVAAMRRIEYDGESFTVS